MNQLFHLQKGHQKTLQLLVPGYHFLRYTAQLRGIEQGLMDILAYPDLVEGALDRIEDIQTKMMKRFLDEASGYVDMVFHQR